MIFSWEYPNVKKIFQLILTIPNSNAEVERGFSQLNLIKSDTRSSLSKDRLIQPMDISLNGPNKAEDLEVDKITETFLNKKERRKLSGSNNKK